MDEWPSGLVAFLFTDVENSTRTWAENADGMAASLRVHDRLIRQCVESSNGKVFATGGDSFAAVFDRASDALDAALSAQAQLVEVEWPGPRLSVRMGVHIGEADERGRDYFGPAVNTTARVEAAGHGGQVLITETVRGLLGDEVGTEVVDLGVRRLRDVSAPLRLFQVGPGDFGPLRGLEVGRTSLPARRTRLLGREREITDTRHLMDDARLVTVVGPGGIGKTSLAVEVAGKIADRYDGGAHFVDLASVSTGDDVVAAMCRGLRLVLSGDPWDHLTSFLVDRRVLLLIDNCEHVIDDVADVVDRLLAEVPTVQMLATSREHIDIDGERLVRLGALHDESGAVAVRLFVERAIAVNSAFDPDRADLAMIARICERLDELPLAIELAAGRTRTMSLGEIEARLDERLSLLAGTRRGRLRRQQTLRATIEWSIDLLDEDGIDDLARLCVFVGGFDLDAAAAVISSDRDTADTIAALEAKSLVQRVDDLHGRARYRILESVREWGLEHLDRVKGLRDARDAHARYFAESLAAVDLYHVMLPETTARWAPDLADIALAIHHLRGDEPIAAAVMILPNYTTLTTSGHGLLALNTVTEARGQQPEHLAARLWATQTVVALMLMLTDVMFAEPPIDDGSTEWRYLVGSADTGYTGWVGWIAALFEPAAVIHSVESLPPLGDDHAARWERSFSLSNATIAYHVLGHHEQALAAFEHSVLLTEQANDGQPAGREIATVNAAATAGLLLHRDLRGTPTDEQAQRQAATSDFMRAVLAITSSDPDDRPQAIAGSARDFCDGRLLDEESLYLAVLAHLAIEDGDLDRGALLNAGLAIRSPSTGFLTRYNDIRINGQPESLVHDEVHHQQHLRAILATDTDPTEQRRANHTKLLDEIKRRLG